VPVKDLTPEEAQQLAGGPLGSEMQYAVFQYATPIFWVVSPRPNGTDDQIRNGTTFFLDCGKGVFGVTAGHVYDAAATAAATGVACQIGASTTPIDLRDRLISRGRDVDIATYRVSPAEVATFDAVPLTGWQATWPPKPPEVDSGVMYGGYPGVARRITKPWRIEFNSLTSTGVANSVSDRDISTVIERDVVVVTMGLEMPPEGYDLAGMSGGPMLTVVQGDSVIGWRLAGVIYSCSRSLGEIVVAARADFIAADGSIVE
jgi:hypothetical protein